MTVLYMKNFPALDVTDEEEYYYQNPTEWTLATNKERQMIFPSKNKTENLTSIPQSDWEGRLCIHNILVIVRKKNEPTRYASRNMDDIASVFLLFLF